MRYAPKRDGFHQRTAGALTLEAGPQTVILHVHECALAWGLACVIALSLAASAQQTDQASPAQYGGTPGADPEMSQADAGTGAMFPHFQNKRLWLSGQANFIFQTHPEFHARYSGPQSLGTHYDKATSRVMTLFTGVRVTNSLELLVNIEESGGAALSAGFGLAGNTNLDIVRNPSLSKAPYLGRAEIHMVFALSRDKVENQRTAFSLFDELPRRRLELRFGK